MTFEQLDKTVVMKTLELAVSQEPSVLKDGENKLKAYERISGYYTLLLSIVKNPEIHQHLRLLAALILKNGIERHWRGVVKEEEKLAIRREILTAAGDPVYQLALQMAVVIGIIARADINRWPEVIPSVLQAVKSQEPLHQHRSLLVLNHIIKALVSKRLLRDKLLFCQISEQIFSYTLELLAANVSVIGEYAGNKESRQRDFIQILELCILILKVLRKLLVYGVKEFQKESVQMNFLQFILQNIRLVLKKRTLMKDSLELEGIEKLLTLMMQVLLNAHECLPLSFVPVLETALIFAMEVAFSNELAEYCFDLLKVKCFNFVQRVIRCSEYRPRRGSIAQDEPQCLEAFQIRLTLFNPNNLSEFIRRICFQYFPMKHEELELWDADPEAFVGEETGASMNYMLRPSAESLFLGLFYEFRESVTPVIADLVRPINESGVTGSESMQMILERDTVYFAAGLASYELFDDLNFDEWFAGHLIKELESKDMRLKLIRYRVIWLIGRWINVKFSRKNRVLLYRALVHLLDEKEDLVVRITAAKTLKAAVDDFEFNSEDFLPFLDELFKCLLALLVQTQECDTKLALLQVTSVVIERLGKKVQPHCQVLVTYLAQIWSESSHHKLLQSAIVTTFTHLVQSFGLQSEQLHPILIPVIRFSTDMTQEVHIHLMDNGLELWQALLQHAPRMTEDLLHLYAAMVPLLDRASENLRLCMSITESYLILDAQAFLHAYSKDFLETLDNLLGTVNLEGNIILARLMELVLQLHPVDGATLFQNQLVKILGVILVDEEYPPLMAVFLSLFAYIITQSPQIFIQVVSIYSIKEEKNAEDVMGALIDIWLEKVDSMTKEDRRKLTAVTMCSLLPSNNSIVNQRFALILDMVVNALYDTAKCFSSHGGPEPIIRDELQEVEISEAAEERRKRQIRKQDPVLQIDLRDYVKTKLREAQFVMGEPQFNELMETLDSVVAKQLMAFVTAP